MQTACRTLLFLLAFSFEVISLPVFAQQVIATIPVGAVPLDLAVDSATNKIYVADACGNDPNCQSGGTVTVIDGVTLSTTTVTVGAGSGAVAVNPATNKIYVANACGNDHTCQTFNGTVTVIDGVTLNTTTVSVGLYPNAVAVNPVTNKIYVANLNDNTVTVIDGATLSTNTVAVGDVPFAVAVNSVTNKIYVVNIEGNTVTVIDGATLSTTNVVVGSSPYSLAVNSVTNKIYVANSCGNDFSCDTHSGTVTVIDGATLSTNTVAVGGSGVPYAIAVNSVTNTIYVPNKCGNDPTCQTFNGTVTVIDGATLSTATVAAGSAPSYVAVNSVTNAIYVSNSCGNDPSCQTLKGTVTAIDGTTLSTTTVAVGQNPYTVGIDSVTDRMYVVNQADNTVSVIVGVPTYKILHNFGSGSGDPDGFWLYAGLVMDNNGNMYGTTSAGGTGVCGQYGCGTVFQMTPNADGSWTENVLYNFSGSDGAGPWAPVVFDGRGNLYGTTFSGGGGNSGTVFEMTPNANGTWTLSTLHGFSGGWDGANPKYPGLTVDNAGHIYGASSAGGIYGYGVVFDLGHVSVFSWYELVAHIFAAGSDGSTPYGALISDASGNLYGTTFYGGGANNAGTVFKLTPNKLSFGWSETVPHTFTGGSDGACPSAGLVFDAEGNLYGTSQFGGPVNNGTVFKMTPNADGTWTESVIYGFQTYGNVDGLNPVGGVTFDKAGNLYGTTSGGGLYGQGIVFELTPSAGGQWTETILHNFGGTVDGQLDGVDPQAEVLLDNAGNIYGTTFEGGTAGITRGGVVFEIIP